MHSYFGLCYVIFILLVVVLYGCINIYIVSTFMLMVFHFVMFTAQRLLAGLQAEFTSFATPRTPKTTVFAALVSATLTCIGGFRG